MRFRTSAASFLAVLLLSSGAPAGAQEQQRPAPHGGVLSLLPLPSVTQHSIALPGGETLAYEAKAGTLALLGGAGEITAEIFYTFYKLKPEPGRRPVERPVTFVFNGGPGAASAYLHLGALGPRVLATGEGGEFLPPPQRLEDNPDTWLGMTDLVFVDPGGTGYSRVAPGQEERNFWGVNQDASALGAFIRLFLQGEERTRSPLYLVGESYGGFRAALLAKTLQEDVGIAPRGIVLVSPAIELNFVRGDDLQPLTWALTLPSMAAVKLSREGVTGAAFDRRLAQAERYALSDYLVALAGGLEEGGRAASGEVAQLTGLPLPLVEKHFARIPAEVFAKETARDSREVLSLYDGTIAGPDAWPQSPRLGPDAVLDQSVPVLTSAFVDYARNELNFRTSVSYRLLNREASRQWDYGARQEFNGVLDDLQDARALNPSLDVLIVHGTADLVTPYMASRYLVQQLPPLARAKPIRLANYPGGHMMYFRDDSRAALKRDAVALYGPAS
ncbi:MAG TPA: peptidase S10 [Mesorhizobium sp.]|jgi:carboxypeptidase C (cathepsin A)|nr:peptidase S10 [Mesorhizobium sp.]